MMAAEARKRAGSEWEGCLWKELTFTKTPDRASPAHLRSSSKSRPAACKINGERRGWRIKQQLRQEASLNLCEGVQTSSSGQ